MSYQTSIHFDPTALLIIKKEVDNSIQQVETAVSSLVEDQTLPFGIDDALLQFEQCAQVMMLIDMPQLAQLTQYSADVMRKIMQTPNEIKTQDVVALSEGTTMLRRYIEFICLREVRVPQFLLDTLNNLEIALGKPLTQEGQPIVSALECIEPKFNLPQAPELEKSVYIHKLYKLSLQKLLNQAETGLDFQALKLVGTYLANLAQNTPSQQYWNLVHVALNELESLALSDARLRILISIETHIAQFFKAPENFKVEMIELANVLSLCISRDDELSQHIRDQIGVGEDVLTDSQLQVFSRHLFGPDFDTIHVAAKLITEEMTQIRNEIEYNYQSMSEDKVAEIKTKLFNLANVFKVLNLNEAFVELKMQAENLSQDNMQNNPQFAQQLMNSILSAMNSIGILERNFSSSRLQLRVNNMHISLDRLDEAHQVLLNETKSLVDLTSNTLIQYLEDPQATNLEPLPSQLKEISGAMLFLSAQEGQQALLNSQAFLELEISKERQLTQAQVERLLDVLASAEMLIENLQNKQPILQSMFDVALKSSQNLKAIA
ncbi:chemotaxis protein [Acinetobacter sp. 187]|uniref:chemotaxis protein n=1 Tax=Acinetobacter lanii TaxID=2715163 RepID=UPI00140A8DCF|nr:chemotaxis protein [Acinetobacter lanii]NHC04232.1 chemotaxis protein [Acinetobacter lanii]